LDFQGCLKGFVEDTLAKVPCRMGKIIELLRKSPELLRQPPVPRCHLDAKASTPIPTTDFRWILIFGRIVSRLAIVTPTAGLNFSGTRVAPPDIILWLR
jgi:hypothetical protein